MIKTIPKRKKCKKSKWLSDEPLQKAEKRREAKGKGEKEKHTHLKAEFQRIARRHKKVFKGDQSKEIEENNRMGKTRDLFKKIRDTKGTFPENAMAPHSSTLAWKIPWMEEPGGPQSMGSLRVGQDSATSLSLFTFLHWRKQWQPTPVFLPGESQGRESLVGCRLWGRRVGHN